jgi:hypothetical protein
MMNSKAAFRETGGSMVSKPFLRDAILPPEQETISRSNIHLIRAGWL